MAQTFHEQLWCKFSLLLVFYLINSDSMSALSSLPQPSSSDGWTRCVSWGANKMMLWTPSPFQEHNSTLIWMGTWSCLSHIPLQFRGDRVICRFLADPQANQAGAQNAVKIFFKASTIHLPLWVWTREGLVCPEQCLEMHVALWGTLVRKEDFCRHLVPGGQGHIAPFFTVKNCMGENANMLCS